MRQTFYLEGLREMIYYVKDRHKMSMIEIGSYAGDSTMLFAQNFKKVLSIDPYLNDYDINDPACKYMDFDKVYEHFKKNISIYKNIKHIRKTSDEAIKELTKKVDLVYIDGLHTYEQVKKDIINYLPLIKEGGYISGHDYHENWQGVIDAIHETIGEPDMIFKDTSWIKKC